MSYRNNGRYEAAGKRSFPKKISFGPTKFHKILLLQTVQVMFWNRCLKQLPWVYTVRLLLRIRIKGYRFNWEVKICTWRACKTIGGLEERPVH
jgi:hypothetical protein